MIDFVIVFFNCILFCIVFIVLDGIGIIVEIFSYLILVQFEMKFCQVWILFVDMIDKVYVVVVKINEVFYVEGVRLIVFIMLVDVEVNEIVYWVKVIILDMFQIFIELFERELNFKFIYVIGWFYQNVDIEVYKNCIEVINFLFVYDDGQLYKNLVEVDVILVGVLCSGKMLISLYLVM